MEGYPVTTPVQVRWRDTDAMGHVNNVVFMTYFEMGRVAFYREVIGIKTVEEIDFILASIRCDFLAPIMSFDDIEVSLRVSSVGRSSFDFEYLVSRRGNGKPLAKGNSTQVIYDYATARKKEVSAEWLEKVERAQKGPIERR